MIFFSIKLNFKGNLYNTYDLTVFGWYNFLGSKSYDDSKTARNALESQSAPRRRSQKIRVNRTLLDFGRIILQES